MVSFWLSFPQHVVEFGGPIVPHCQIPTFPAVAGWFSSVIIVPIIIASTHCSSSAVVASACCLLTVVEQRFLTPYRIVVPFWLSFAQHVVEFAGPIGPHPQIPTFLTAAGWLSSVVIVPVIITSAHCLSSAVVASACCLSTVVERRWLSLDNSRGWAQQWWQSSIASAVSCCCYCCSSETAVAAVEVNSPDNMAKGEWLGNNDVGMRHSPISWLRRQRQHPFLDHIANFLSLILATAASI